MKDHKKENEKTPMIECNESELQHWNSQGYGIFWTFNEFKNNQRTKENCTKINFWAVEIDEGSKESQIEKIRSGLVPSLVIETKRGFHIYFFAEDATNENFLSIVEDRLIPFYESDNLKDVSRVYRVPNFYHQKDPNNKFLVNVWWYSDILYSENSMLCFYPDANADKRNEYIEKSKKIFSITGVGDSVYEKIYNLNQMEALEIVSGSDSVRGEIFTFQKVSRSRYNIFVNSEPTNCFIDEFGKIGAKGGGPTIATWINWYWNDWKKTFSFLRKHFPNLFEDVNAK